MVRLCFPVSEVTVGSALPSEGWEPGACSERERVMLVFQGLSDLTKSLNTIFSSYAHLPAVELPSVYTMFLLSICQLYGS